MFRNICFTLNNYTETETKQLKDLECKYIVFGFEVGESGTPHLQGYLELSKRMRFNALIKYLGTKRCHIEKRKGTSKQAINYCKKDNNFFEKGTCSNQGCRTDLSKIKDLIKEGNKLSVIIDSLENLNYQQIRGAQLLKGIFSKKRNTKPIIMWLYGSTGMGKTRFVYDNYEDIYSADNGKWFDGYEQNNVILVDDYRRDFMKFHILLKFIDRYAFTREYKGGTLQIDSKYIIFTSPKHPYKVWRNRTSEDIEQLLRRIDIIVNFDLRNAILCR